MMNKQRRYAMLAGLMLMAGCTQAQDAPTQVIYRFDDHRYLELKGWNCEGALYYVDPVRGIRSEVASQFYRAFADKYVHPPSATLPFLVGNRCLPRFKNYGETWQVAPFNTGFHTVEPDGSNSPSRENMLSFTVVNDQGFLNPPGQSLHELKALR
jgi:hypothetical protein